MYCILLWSDPLEFDQYLWLILDFSVSILTSEYVYPASIDLKYL
jgi:hypothetical protein